MAQSITKNALYNALLNVAAVIFPFITAPYISRVLEPDGVGLVNFTNIYAGYFAIAAMLGIPTYGVREVAKLREDKTALTDLVSKLISIAVITTVGVSLIYLMSITLIGKLSENFIILLIAGFVIYLAPFKVNWYFQGIEDFSFITKISLLVRTACVICLFIFVRDKSDLVVYVIISVLGTVLADFLNYFKMRRDGIKPRLTLKGLKPHICPLLVLFTSVIAISLYTVLDTLMLGFITDYEQVGYYSNSMHMSKVVLSAVTSLSLVAVPRVSYYMKDKDYNQINQLINQSFSIVSFLAIPLAIGLACVAPSFIPLFFGPKFMGSIVPLTILSMLIIIIGFNNLTGMQILLGMGFDKLFLYSVLVGTVSNFLLNFFLIPVMGAIGASIASVVAETLVLFVTILFVYKRTPIRIGSIKDIAKAFVGSLFFPPLIFVLKQHIAGWWLVALFVVLGGIVYLGVEALLRNNSVFFLKAVILRKIKK